jgi:lipid A 3-O-deacylase
MIQVIMLILASASTEYKPIDISAASSLTFAYTEEMLAEQPIKDTQSTPLSVSSSVWGNEGTWRWGLQAGYAWDLKNSENTIGDFGVEFEYFVANNLSLDMGFSGISVDQEGKNTRGFNATLQLRWHCITEDHWSFFLECGAGLLQTSNKVPSEGSSFNFTPQAGLGFTFDIGDQARWMIGAKWYHISNANTHSSNPGLDSIMVWTGISFPF